MLIDESDIGSRNLSYIGCKILLDYGLEKIIMECCIEEVIYVEE